MTTDKKMEKVASIKRSLFIGLIVAFIMSGALWISALKADRHVRFPELVLTTLPFILSFTVLICVFCFLVIRKQKIMLWVLATAVLILSIIFIRIPTTIRIGKKTLLYEPSYIHFNPN